MLINNIGTVMRLSFYSYLPCYLECPRCYFSLDPSRITSVSTFSWNSFASSIAIISTEICLLEAYLLLCPLFSFVSSPLFLLLYLNTSRKASKTPTLFQTASQSLFRGSPLIAYYLGKWCLLLTKEAKTVIPSLLFSGQGPVSSRGQSEALPGF